jgi:hypothetical protein
MSSSGDGAFTILFYFKINIKGIVAAKAAGYTIFPALIDLHEGEFFVFTKLWVKTAHRLYNKVTLFAKVHAIREFRMAEFRC